MYSTHIRRTPTALYFHNSLPHRGYLALSEGPLPSLCTSAMELPRTLSGSFSVEMQNTPRALYPPTVLLRWSYPARSEGPFWSRCRTYSLPSTLLLYFCDGATPHALRVLFGRKCNSALKRFRPPRGPFSLTRYSLVEVAPHTPRSALPPRSYLAQSEGVLHSKRTSE